MPTTLTRSAFEQHLGDARATAVLCGWTTGRTPR